MEDREKFDESRTQEAMDLIVEWEGYRTDLKEEGEAVDPFTGQIVIAATIGVVGREIVRQLEAINSNLNELGALLDRRL